MQKSDIKDVVTKGFTTKWWRDHRANACKGCGVAKAMDKLTQLNVPPTGLPTKTKPEYAADLIPLYTDLLSAFTKASGKCGKAQAETKEALILYRKQTNKALDMAEKMAREWDKDKGQGAINATKELAEVNNTAAVIEKNLVPIPKATAEGDKALKSLVSNYISSQGKEGPDQFDKYLAGVNSVLGSIKLKVHSKNLVEGDKAFKKILNLFKKMAQFTNRMHGSAIAVARQARGEAFSS